MDEKSVDRFWSKVDKRGPVPEHRPELGPCWVWLASVMDTGYGSFSVNGKTTGAHRASWEIHFGLILDGMCALHHCDNRRCVRPDHLFLGTQTDNNADRDSKGRKARGETQGNAKVDEFTVRILRRLSARGLSRALLGRVFGMSANAVSDIALRKRWRHVP